MLKKLLIGTTIGALVMVSAVASHAATLFIEGGGKAKLNTDFSLVSETGLAIGTILRSFDSGTDGLKSGLILSGAPTDVTFTYLGSEAGNTNKAFETEGSTGFLFNSNSASAGDSMTVNMGSDGAVPFRFTSTSCWWIFCDTDSANNDGSIDNGLTIALFQESATSVVALFGDGTGDMDLDDMALRISVTAVPLPPSIVLFGAAVFGLGWLSRRKRRLEAA